MPWAKIVDIPFWQFQHWTLFHDQSAPPACRCARARSTLPPCVIHHRLTLMDLNRCTNVHVASSMYVEIRGPPMCTRAQCTTTPQVVHHRIANLNCISAPNFASLGQSFPKVKLFMHYAPYHKMTCTMELRSSNSISVPNLVSIVQNCLEPEDPSRIKFSGHCARSLHPIRTLLTKTYRLR